MDDWRLGGLVAGVVWVASCCGCRHVAALHAHSTVIIASLVTLVTLVTVLNLEYTTLCGVRKQ